MFVLPCFLEAKLLSEHLQSVLKGTVYIELFRVPLFGVFLIFIILASLKPWPNGLASQRKFAQPEFAYGLANVGQTSRPASSRKSQETCNFTHSCLQMTCETLVSIAYEFELD